MISIGRFIGNEIRKAKMAVARIAAEQIFGLNYTAHGVAPIPPPLYPCVPVQSSLEFHDDDTTWEVEEETTTYHPSTIRVRLNGNH